jgi:hypothetical protein
MKAHGFRAALGAAGFMIASVAAFTAGSPIAAAATVECSGPLKQCAIEVGGFCEIENGKMMIWYKEREGAAMRFEQCVGKVHESHGRSNPYRSGPSQPPASKR